MHTVYRITCSAEWREILLALLADAMPAANYFTESEQGLEAYVPGSVEADATVGALTERYGASYRRELIPERNWNAAWEANFSPIRIDDRLLVRASFHPPAPDVAYELIIDPRMAFGTGHHATTYLMCEALLELGPELVGSRVLDYGCGTGILAILAKQMGAATVDALDIEAGAIENTLENASVNQVTLDTVQTTKLSGFPAPRRPYDLVVANINRNVLLGSADALYRYCGGEVLLSGLLSQDRPAVTTAYRAAGFTPAGHSEREGWCALRFYRP